MTPTSTLVCKRIGSPRLPRDMASEWASASALSRSEQSLTGWLGHGGGGEWLEGDIT